MARPRDGFEALFRQRFTTVNTLTVFRRFDALESFVNEIQQLTIVVRHRHQQLFRISVGCHIRRILRRFRITLATVKLGSLHLAHQTLAPIQQLVSENFGSPLIHLLNLHPT